MNRAAPTISVIINTIDRADSLKLLLESLRHQWDVTFEVVVVAGPCTDHTAEVLEEWAGSIKALECAEPNLSMSRNLGMAAAAGQIVVFIDDDAIPEPRWLRELVEPFARDPEVAATGGYVWDHTGTDLQCRFNHADRFGRARFHAEQPLDDLCYPGSPSFPYVPGGNSAWIKERLLAVGGFDENFEYYLEETDACVRIIDAGWKLSQVPGAAIHHKFLPSSVRHAGKVLTRRYPVLKNRILFGLLNAREYAPFGTVMDVASGFVAEHRADVRHHVGVTRMLLPSAIPDFDQEVERAWVDGLEAGVPRSRRLISPQLRAASPDPLVPFPVLQTDEPRRRYVFVSQSIPPRPIGGIGRYMVDLARGLAAQGQEVRLITDGADHDTIDFEDGVWVHRLVKPATSAVARPPGLEHVPERIWANSARVWQEVDRLDQERPVDAVYSALWDTEALATQALSEIPVVLALVTSLTLALESRPTWAQEPGFAEDFAAPMMRVEREHIQRADVIHAISNSILAEVERSSGVVIPRSRVVVAPLGVAVPSAPRTRIDPPVAVDADDEVALLFVGRFEKRKGIDLLMQALAAVMPGHPGMTATLVGRNDLPGPDGTWIDWLDRELPGGEWRDRLRILGEISDESLQDEYARCDVFVAPSRFESFGLIYIEAMARSLPVVALDAGAAHEVVGEDAGLLVAPDDVEALVGCIEHLASDRELRARMGASGLRRYEELFTVDQMVERVGVVLESAVVAARESA